MITITFFNLMPWVFIPLCFYNKSNPLLSSSSRPPNTPSPCLLINMIGDDIVVPILVKSRTESTRCGCSVYAWVWCVCMCVQWCLTPCDRLDFPGKNTGVGCHILLQEIFPTQELNPCLLCLLHCRWILYSLSHMLSVNSSSSLTMGRCVVYSLERSVIKNI